MLSIAHRSGVVFVIMSTIHRGEFHTLLAGVSAMDRMILFLLVVRATVDYLACLLVVVVANRVEARCTWERCHWMLLSALDAHDLVSSLPSALLQSSPFILAKNSSPTVDPFMLFVTWTAPLNMPLILWLGVHHSRAHHLRLSHSDGTARALDPTIRAILGCFLALMTTSYRLFEAQFLIFRISLLAKQGSLELIMKLMETPALHVALPHGWHGVVHRLSISMMISPRSPVVWLVIVLRVGHVVGWVWHSVVVVRGSSHLVLVGLVLRLGRQKFVLALLLAGTTRWNNTAVLVELRALLNVIILAMRDLNLVLRALQLFLLW